MKGGMRRPQIDVKEVEIGDTKSIHAMKDDQERHDNFSGKPDGGSQTAVEDIV